VKIQTDQVLIFPFFPTEKKNTTKRILHLRKKVDNGDLISNDELWGRKKGVKII